MLLVGPLPLVKPSLWIVSALLVLLLLFQIIPSNSWLLRYLALRLQLDKAIVYILLSVFGELLFKNIKVEINVLLIFVWTFLDLIYNFRTKMLISFPSEIFFGQGRRGAMKCLLVALRLVVTLSNHFTIPFLILIISVVLHSIVI